MPSRRRPGLVPRKVHAEAVFSQSDPPASSPLACLCSDGNGAYQLTIANGSLCATVFGTNPQYGGANVGLQPCLPAASAQSQLFNVSAATLAGQFGAITFLATNDCIEVPDWNINAGIELWSCNGGTNQQWAWQAATSSLVYQNVTDKCLGVC